MKRIFSFFTFFIFLCLAMGSYCFSATYSDDFESGDLSNWSLYTWGYYQSTVSWNLVQDGSQVWEAYGGSYSGGGDSSQYLPSFNSSTDVIVSAKVKTVEVVHEGGIHNSGIAARIQGPGTYYGLILNNYASLLIIYKNINSNVTYLGTSSLSSSYMV